MIRLILAALLALHSATLLAVESSGTTPGGAAFRFSVPDGWQPGGPLVVINHGFNFEVDPTPGLGPLADLWLSQGYAIAASGYRQRAWALFKAMDDNAELVAEFTTEFGAPGALIAVGGSMGGLVSLKMLDDPRFSKLAGVYALCAPADGYGGWDSAFDLRLAYDAVCGEVTGGKLPKGDPPLTWALNLNDIPDNLHDLESAPNVIQALLPVTICTGLGLNASLRFNSQKERLATLMRYAQVDDEEFFTTQLGYAIYALSELVRAPDKLGNRNAFDSRYVGGFSGSDASIDARIPVIAPDPLARFDFARASVPGRIQNTVPGGENQVPVVALYTSKDELVRSYHADAIHGARTLKARVDEPVPSHCGFTAAEVAGGWGALQQVIAGAPVPQTPAAQAQVLKSSCEQAAGLGAAGPCRIDPNSANLPTEGKPRARVADNANITQEHSGIWWDPARSGEGSLLEILPDNRALEIWFTFPPLGAPGAQQWLLGSGAWVGNGFQVDQMLSTGGAHFGDAFNANDVVRTPWGTMAAALDGARDANTGQLLGRMRYAGPVAFGSGEQAFDQLTSMIYAANIELSPPLPTEQWYMGTFYDPARSGEGVILTQDARSFQPGGMAPRVFAFWFTYDLDGRQMWLIGEGTGAHGQYQIDFLRPVGTHFGAAFDPNAVQRQPWGSATVGFSAGCDHLDFSYSSTQPGFGSGNLSLTRLTAPIGSGYYCPTP